MTDVSIRSIVFDVGKVLVDFQFNDLLDFLKEHGLEYKSRHELLERMDLFAYERGEITSDAFLDNVNRLLSSPVDTGELRGRWVNIFTPIPEMLEFAHQLTDVCRVYLLSNASALHWDYLREDLHIDRIGHGQVASFELGLRKPDPAIYRAAEQRFDLAPPHTVFIDDMEENAEAARECGWHAIHHTNPATTQRILRTLPGPHQAVLHGN
jgi:putative hydrolase of the HAD superfamily